MNLVPRAVIDDNIIPGEQAQSASIDPDYSYYWERASKTGSIISRYCSPEIQIYLKGLRAPKQIWESVPVRRCSLARHVGLTGTLHKFRKAQLNYDKIIIYDYFARLREYRHQLARPAEAISDEELHAHI